MSERERDAGAPRNAVNAEMGALQRRIQYALLLITFAPIVVFSACFLRYVKPGAVTIGPVAAVLVAVLVLMLSGTRMLLRLVGAAERNGAAPTSPPGMEASAAGYRCARGEMRSLRHTIAEAVALIGGIPLLAFGYLAVKYVLPVETIENLALVTFMLVAVVSLGVVQVYRVTQRVIRIAVGARRLRSEICPPARETGKDELGALSSDLGAIAGAFRLRSEEIRRLRAFVKLLPEPMLVVDGEGIIIVHNKAAQDLLGYGEGELGGKSATALFVKPEDPEWFCGRRGGGARENQWIRKDGKTVPVSVTVGRLDSESRMSGAIIVATDIAERNRAQEELRESERRARSMFENSPISLWMEDFSGASERIRELSRAGVEDFDRYFREHPEEVRECASRVAVVDVNRATLALYEAADRDDLLKGLDSLVCPDTTVTFIGELLAIAAGKTWYEHDTVAVTLRGNRKHVHLAWSVVPGFEETYGRVLVSIIDITDRVRGAAELRRERDTLRKYMAVSRSIVLVLNLDGKVVFVNEAGCRTLGYPMEEIIGRNWIENFIPERLRKDLNRVFGEIRGGETAMISSMENPVLARDGGERHVSWQNTVLTDDVGAPYAILSSGHDVTEQKKMEEHLFHARKMESVGVLAGGIAHDFNNILAGIVGYTYLVKQGIPQGSRNAADLDAIERLAMRGSRLTKALLAFAHGGDCTPELVGANEIVEEVLQVMERTASPKIRISHTPAPAGDSIFVDKLQFRQCLMNLCLNACEAMPDGGALSVKTERVIPDASFLGGHPGLEHGAYVAISISDSGAGMTSHVRKRIFDPFFTTKQDRTGTGLGLPIAHGIIERAGGALVAESIAGKGSTFTIYLPARSAGAGGSAPAPPTRRAGGRAILLVDDEADFRSCTARWLARLGYRVIEATSGEEAVKIAGKRGGEIGLVLLDMLLKGWSGAETFRRIREVAPGILIIICSGYAMDIACQELIRDGAVGFVQKPFEHAALASRIGELIGPAAPPA